MAPCLGYADGLDGHSVRCADQSPVAGMGSRLVDNGDFQYLGLCFAGARWISMQTMSCILFVDGLKVHGVRCANYKSTCPGQRQVNKIRSERARALRSMTFESSSRIVLSVPKRHALVDRRASWLSSEAELSRDARQFRDANTSPMIRSIPISLPLRAWTGVRRRGDA